MLVGTGVGYFLTLALRDQSIGFRSPKMLSQSRIRRTFV
jgi:hypothetical protein